jgi:alpha-tubulin suppressor-like RCC1 family protein
VLSGSIGSVIDVIQHDWIALSAGSGHSLALLSDGTLWAWGRNAWGELGDGTTEKRSTPVQVRGLTNVQTIAAGGDHSFAVLTDGSVWAWGLNHTAQLGDGTTTSRRTPTHITNLTDVKAIAAGLGHSLALRSSGPGVC